VLVVVNISCEHEMWALPPGHLASLQERFGGVSFHWNREQRGFHQEVSRAEVVWGWRLTPELLSLAQDLKWFHTCAAGVASSLSPELLKSKVILTNSAGVSAPTLAEHTLGMLLTLTRDLRLLADSQLQRHWCRPEVWARYREMREIGRMTVGFVGFGAVARRLAQAVHALGARVLVYRRTGREDPLAERTFTGAGINEMLPLCGIVVNALPETPETVGFFNEARLKRMKEGALFVNIGRGCTVDEPALIRALGWDERGGEWRTPGWLGGAVLDVFAEEPLPPDSPLWRAEHVLISPHIAAVSPHFWERETALFSENLRRYLAGEPLLNVVDPARGY
jgi:D-2-hydroxyacid dehydrogenase (NADP+)